MFVLRRPNHLPLSARTLVTGLRAVLRWLLRETCRLAPEGREMRPSPEREYLWGYAAVVAAVLADSDEAHELERATEHAERFTGIAPAAQQDRTLTVFPVSSQGLFTRENGR